MLHALPSPTRVRLPRKPGNAAKAGRKSALAREVEEEPLSQVQLAQQVQPVQPVQQEQQMQPAQLALETAVTAPQAPEPPHLFVEPEPEVATARTSLVLRRDSGDLAKVMRQRRKSCEAWESAPCSSTADTSAAHAPPELRAAETVLPSTRWDSSDLMEVMRQRREGCKEWESAPNSSTADILASHAPTDDQILPVQYGPAASPMRRRRNADFADVMRQRRESCGHEMLQSPFVLRQTPGRATSVESSPTASPVVRMQFGLLDMGTPQATGGFLEPMDLSKCFPQASPREKVDAEAPLVPSVHVVKQASAAGAEEITLNREERVTARQSMQAKAAA